MHEGKVQVSTRTVERIGNGPHGATLLFHLLKNALLAPAKLEAKRAGDVVVGDTRPHGLAVPNSESVIPSTKLAEAGQRFATGIGPMNLGAQVSTLARELDVGQAQEIEPQPPMALDGAARRAEAPGRKSGLPLPGVVRQPPREPNRRDALRMSRVLGRMHRIAGRELMRNDQCHGAYMTDEHERSLLPACQEETPARPTKRRRRVVFDQHRSSRR